MSRQHCDTMEAQLSHIVCHGNRWLAVEVASEGTFLASPGREFVRHSASADVEEVNQEWELHLSHSLLLFSSHCPSPPSLSLSIYLPLSGMTVFVFVSVGC